MLLGAALPLLVPKWLEPEGCGAEPGWATPTPPALELAGRAADDAPLPELVVALGAAALGAGAAACGFASAIGFATGAFRAELARLVALLALLRVAVLRAGAFRAPAVFRVALVLAEERPAAVLRAVERLAVLFRAAGLRAEVLRAEVLRAALLRAAGLRAAGLRAAGLRAELLRAELLPAEVLRAPLLRAAAPALRFAGLRAAGLRAVVFLALVFLAVAPPRAPAVLREVDFLLVVRFFPLVFVAMMFAPLCSSAAFASFADSEPARIAPASSKLCSSNAESIIFFATRLVNESVICRARRC